MTRSSTAFITDKDGTVQDFMQNLRELLKTGVFVKEPISDWKRLDDGRQLNFISIKMPVPAWVPLVLGYAMVALSILLGKSWISYLSFPMLTSLYFYNPMFLFKKAKKALKRKGYTGPIKQIKLKEVGVYVFGKN